MISSTLPPLQNPRPAPVSTSARTRASVCRSTNSCSSWPRSDEDEDDDEEANEDDKYEP